MTISRTDPFMTRLRLCSPTPSVPPPPELGILRQVLSNFLKAPNINLETNQRLGISFYIVY